MAEVMAYFRIQNNSIILYLDDFLFFVQEKENLFTESTVDFADLLEVGLEGQSGEILRASLPEGSLFGLPEKLKSPKIFFFQC